MNGERIPYRCTSCGSQVQQVVKSVVAPSLDASFSTLDERYTTGWCQWCRRLRPAIKAATVKEATSLQPERQPPPPSEQLKGGW